MNKTIKIFLTIIILIIILCIIVFSKIKLHTYNPIRAIIGYIQVTKFDKEYVEVGNIPTKTIYASADFDIEKYMNDRGYTKIEERTIKAGDDWYTNGESGVLIERWCRRGIVIYEWNKENKELDESKLDIKEKNEEYPEPINIEEAVNNGWFVIDNKNEKVYNKDLLDKFIENTSINAKNRIDDKITIAHYNMNSEPIIYYLEYKTFDETYINEKQEKVNKKGYILKIDPSRINSYEVVMNYQEQIETHKVKIIDDIPGQFYGITLRNEPEFNVSIIELSLYAEINYISSDAKIYEEIEITRFQMDSEIIND